MANTRTPVQYAETDLGVHTEFEAAQALIHELDVVRKAHVEVVNEIRTLRGRLSDREYEIALKVREDFELPSAAAYDRKLKELTDGDDTIRAGRSKLIELLNAAEQWDAEVNNLERQIKLKTARVGELGGYLKYLAACMAAQTEASQQLRNPLASLLA